MAATPYRAVSWQPNEVISEGKMDQLANNGQWLFENMPRARYTAHGVRRAEGVRIACGLCLVPAGTVPNYDREVYFGDFFSSGCMPIVTTAFVSNQRRVWVTIAGLGRFHPDDRGFQVHVTMGSDNPENDQLHKDAYVSWQAMGY